MLLVLGSGFAGLSAALRARRYGVDVIVVSGRERIVDAPECLTLEGLRAVHDCGLDARDIRAPQVRGHVSRWGSAETDSRLLPSDIPGGILLGRASLLDSLRSCAIEAGVTFEKAGELERIRPKRHGLQLLFSNAVLQSTLDAAFVVDASGRNAVFARKQGVSRRTFDSLVAYGVRGPVHNMPVGVTYTFSVADGWIFSVSEAIGKAHACFYTNGRRAGRIDSAAVVQRLPAEIRSFISDEEAWLSCSVSAANASTSLLDVPGGPYWLACGDALQTVDPLSSSGITTALQQGAAAAEAALASMRGNIEPMKTYWKSTRTQFDGYVRDRNSYYGFDGDA